MADSSVEALKKLHSQAAAARGKIESEWYLNVAYYHGDQWIFWNRGRIDRPKLKPWRVTFVDNRIQGICVARIARKTKNRPVFVARPFTGDDEDMDATEITEKILENDWTQLNLDHQYLMVNMWSEICGAGFWKIYWDSTKGQSNDFLYQNGQPVLAQDKRPLKKDDLEQSEFYTSADETTQEKMRTGFDIKNIAQGDCSVDVISPFEVFPDPLASSLDECEWVIEEKIRSKEYIRAHYDYDPTLDADAPIGITESRSFNASSSSSTEYRGAKIYEYYCRPNSEYPNGKWCVWCNEKQLREKDGPDSPYAEFPYVMFSSQLVPGRFWPTSITSQLRGPQTHLNKIESQIRENAIRIGNPAVMVARQANVEMHGVPGEKILFDDTIQNPMPSFLQPPEMPGYVKEEIDRIQQSMIEISGLHEVSNASVPSGITAASAINLLQEADDTRLGPEIQMNEKALADAGTKLVKLRAKFNTDERTIQIAGEDGAWDIFSFRNTMLKDNINVDVQAGSGKPRSKAAQQAAMQEFLNLAMQYGVEIDPRSLRKFFRDYEAGGLDRLLEDVSRDELQVVREHRKMYNGTAVNITDVDNDDIHIFAHQDEMKSSKFDKTDPEIQKFFYAHLNAHKERRIETIDMQVQDQAPPPEEPPKK